MNKDDIIPEFLPTPIDHPIQNDLPEVEFLKLVLLRYSKLTFEEFWDIINEYKQMLTQWKSCIGLHMDEKFLNDLYLLAVKNCGCSQAKENFEKFKEDFYGRQEASD